MSCFDNIIGIGGCDETTPSSGVYLRDAGISIDELNLIAGVDFESGQDLANKKITFATKTLLTSIYNKFQDKYIAKSFLENQRVGYFQHNKAIKSSSNQYRGVELELRNSDSYVDLYIDKVEFFSQYTGNVTLIIKDVYQNKLLDSFTIAAISGEIVSKTIDKTYISDKKKLHLFIGYDATGIDVYNTQLLDAGCSTCGAGTMTNCNNWVRARGVYATSSNVLEENLFGLSHTGGLSLLYSLKCNHEEWLCRYKNEIAIALCYKTCEDIMSYAMYQTSRNNHKIFDKEMLGERMIFYRNKYDEVIENLLGNIQTPNDSKCYICKKPIISRVSIP